MINNIKDFIKETDVDERLINKYKGIVPDEMIEFWGKYGFGSLVNGYLKSVNPEEFKEVLLEGSVRYQNSVVLFSTSMGDLIIWSDNYVRMLNFRYGVVETILFKFDFFFQNVADEYFRDKYMKWVPYAQVVSLYGLPKYNECFGYVPLLGIGGTEKVENLEKVKLMEHLQIIIQFMGPIA